MKTCSHIKIDYIIDFWPMKTCSHMKMDLYLNLIDILWLGKIKSTKFAYHGSQFWSGRKIWLVGSMISKKIEEAHMEALEAAFHWLDIMMNFTFHRMDLLWKLHFIGVIFRIATFHWINIFRLWHFITNIITFVYN